VMANGCNWVGCGRSERSDERLLLAGCSPAQSPRRAPNRPVQPSRARRQLRRRAIGPCFQAWYGQAEDVRRGAFRPAL